MVAGYGLGEILAGGGETIRFTPETFVVGGRIYPRRADMPTSGSWTVPENHWFVWPELRMNVRGQGAAVRLEAALHDLSMVDSEDVLGRPCKRWFWRKQQLP